MKKSVYIETSVVSYLTARASRDLVSAAHQQLTKEWWDGQRSKYELYSSRVVLQEIAAGDAAAAERRIEALKACSLLEDVADVRALAQDLMDKGALPEKARDDALHIAFAAVHGVDFLLTWNCRYIDNPFMKPLIRQVCIERGCPCPEICTPEELGGGWNG